MPDEYYKPFFDGKKTFEGFVYEMEHAFANDKAFFFVLTYVAILLGAIVGPGLALFAAASWTKARRRYRGSVRSWPSTSL